MEGALLKTFHLLSHRSGILFRLGGNLKAVSTFERVANDNVFRTTLRYDNELIMSKSSRGGMKCHRSAIKRS